ncbi:MAG: FadR/GntR family transcriptional regulator [Anaerolineae bacterium]
MAVPLRRVDQQPLVSQSAQAIIKEYVVANRLRPGDPLPPETELVRQLGIGRNSVREAVRALAALGLVEVRRGSGLFVGQFSVESILDSLAYPVAFELDELSDLLAVRRALEVGMADVGIAAVSADQICQLRGIVDRMRDRAEQGESFPEEDREFHQALWANLNNSVLMRLLDTFWLTFNTAATHTDLTNRNPMRTYQNHAAIVDAIEVRDVAKVRLALDQHYADLSERIAEARRRREETGSDDTT